MRDYKNYTMNRILFLLGVMMLSLVACKSSKDTVDNTTQGTQLDTRAARQRGTGQRPQRGNVDEMFARMDNNGDNRLAIDEVKGRMAERFDAIDLDKDGYLSKEEMTKAPRPQR